jgi:hypothetical protein
MKSKQDKTVKHLFILGTISTSLVVSSQQQEAIVGEYKCLEYLHGLKAEDGHWRSTPLLLSSKASYNGLRGKRIALLLNGLTLT